MRQRYSTTLEELHPDTAEDGTKVFWCDETFLGSDMLAAQQDFSAPVLKMSQVLLKRARQRFIFGHPAEPKTVVFKLFPLRSIISKLRHRKYAFREFINMRRARNLSLPVPQAIAFLEKRRMGLVVCAGLIQENLAGATDLQKMQNEGEDFNKVTKLATDILNQTFNAGANHVDLRGENIMVQAESGKIYMIDWQYASFVSARAEWLLEYLAAYFIVKSPISEKARLVNEWLPQLHEACTHPLILERFVKRVNALIERRPRERRRLALKPIKGL